jgi:hypothetical protein
MSVRAASDRVAEAGPHQAAGTPGLFYVTYLGDSGGACPSGTFSPGFATPKYVALAAGLVDSPAVEHDPIPIGVQRLYGVVLGPGVVRVRSTVTGDEQEAHERVRGEVEEWSRRSRLRMVETMASLDWGPVLEPDRPGWRPAMVTLTMPGGDWLALAPDGPAFKRIMGRFRRRWEREWGSVHWVWKLEFQRRGAPHLHLYSACGSDRGFREWVSLAWTCSVFGLRAKRREGETWMQLVERVRGKYGDQVGDHLEAGAGIDWAEGIRASDPKRLAVYFLKRATGHNLGADKEYQHYVPEAWREAEAGPGRFWGYSGLDKCTQEVALHPGHFVALRRLLRRWAAANGRPLPWLGSSRMAGGMVLANDAPGLLAQAVRFLATVEVNDAHTQRTTADRATQGAVGRGRRLPAPRRDGLPVALPDRPGVDVGRPAMPSLLDADPGARSAGVGVALPVGEER